MKDLPLKQPTWAPYRKGDTVGAALFARAAQLEEAGNWGRRASVSHPCYWTPPLWYGPPDGPRRTGGLPVSPPDVEVVGQVGEVVLPVVVVGELEGYGVKMEEGEVEMPGSPQFQSYSDQVRLPQG